MSTKKDKPNYVLLIEASKHTRKSVGKILSADYEIIEADDAASGWEELVDNDSIAVLIAAASEANEQFPLLERVRHAQDPKIANMPVLLLVSGADEDKLKEDALAAGASDFISVPFSSSEIKARVQTQIKNAENEQKINEQELDLTQQAVMDSLTEMPNKKYFMDRAVQELAFAIRHSVDFSIICMSIDRIGALSDAHGEGVAAGLIKKSAEILKAHVRREDTVAYFGDGQFAFLLPGTAGGGAMVLAKRVLKSLEAIKVKLKDARIELTASAGVVDLLWNNDKSIDDFIAIAAKRMAAAVSDGGNKVLSSDVSGATEQALPTPTVDRALRMIKAGQGEQISEHLKDLMLSVIPLLEYA
ncbi:MAG: diguanylate cyclase, partial [Gammaproteobacteria bacterium]|nr:diguanylate cyclase [Gammaproteobacteria bacterium]